MIAVAPIDGPRPVPESAWIKISDEAPEDRAGWSPDGKMLYFTSERDGHRCFYAQRVDGVSRRPVGEAFAVQHFHRNLWYLHGGWSTADGKIVFGLVDGRENVWMMSRAGGSK
jgi:Tol biopolymer transport system component